MGKNSQEQRGSNSLSKEHKLLVLHRCWGSLDTIWLICTNIKYEGTVAKVGFGPVSPESQEKMLTAEELK